MQLDRRHCRMLRSAARWVLALILMLAPVLATAAGTAVASFSRSYVHAHVHGDQHHAVHGHQHEDDAVHDHAGEDEAEGAAGGMTLHVHYEGACPSIMMVTAPSTVHAAIVVERLVPAPSDVKPGAPPPLRFRPPIVA